jgi:hypothetical protein
VGAPKDTDETGAVYILYLQSSTSTPVKGWVKISSLCGGVATGTWLGRSLASLFDVNGDGGQSTGKTSILGLPTRRACSDPDSAVPLPP